MGQLFIASLLLSLKRLHIPPWSRFSFIESLQSEKTEGPWAFRQSDPTETEVYFIEVDASYIEISRETRILLGLKKRAVM